MKNTVKAVLALTFLGSVSVAQAQRTFGDGVLPEFLVPFDVNEDGKLDKEEALAARDARKAARELPPRDVDKRTVVDTDGDGKVSPAERDALQAKLRTRIQARRAEKFYDVAGEDELISYEEFSELTPFKDVYVERILSLFARLDESEDGFVSLDEFTARLRKRPGRTTGGRPIDTDDDGDTVPTSPGGPTVPTQPE